MTPFRAVYGRDPSTIHKYQLDHTDPPSLQEFLHQHNDILSQLKKNLVKAQIHMKKFVDKQRIPLEFQVGSWFLSNCNHTNNTQCTFTGTKSLASSTLAQF